MVKIESNKPTHKRHWDLISEYQLSHGKRTVDFSDPTGTAGQEQSFLDDKARDGGWSVEKSDDYCHIQAWECRA